ncbi:MAG: Mor transcription activator family protein [Chromatiales bacterium]|jgi:Mor family transcriptional regulator
MESFVEFMYEEIIQSTLQCGVKPDVANSIAEMTEDSIRWTKGGIEHYIHGPEIEKRNAQIVSEFNGQNHDKLARRYGISRRQIYSIIKRHYQRRQSAA